MKWLDSCAPHRIWQDVEDAKDYGVLPCISASFFIKRDKNCVVLAQSIGQSQVGHVTAIPASCIKSIKVIE